MYCADTTFGVCSQALAITQLLGGILPDFAPWDDKIKDWDFKSKTYPWYNGREKGVCLVVSRGGVREGLYIFFGEERASNYLFVDHVVHNDPDISPPTLDNLGDVYEEAMKNRRLFEAKKIGETVDYIVDLMRDQFAVWVSRRLDQHAPWRPSTQP